jgi:hypothetical protein
VYRNSISIKRGSTTEKMTFCGVKVYSPTDLELYKIELCTSSGGCDGNVITPSIPDDEEIVLLQNSNESSYTYEFAPFTTGCVEC